MAKVRVLQVVYLRLQTPPVACLFSGLFPPSGLAGRINDLDGLYHGPPVTALKEAQPSMAVEVMGWRALPEVGADILEVEDEVCPA